MDNSLERSAGRPLGPPGGPPGGVVEWRAVSRVLKSPGRTVVNAAQSIVHDLVATLLPADCSVCSAPLLYARESPVCRACYASLREQDGALCVRCGEELDLDGAHYRSQYGAEALRCSPCRLAPPPFERAHAWGVYQDNLRELMHLLKYERMRSVAAPLGDLLARVIGQMAEAGMPRDLVVIAVPLFGARQRQRGFNQSRLIADEALRTLRSPDWNLCTAHAALRRVRDTESQFELSPAGRRRNLKGAFAVADPAAVAGREVLLVDDIYTTGATARECARILRQAGAKRVWVATVARAQRERIARWKQPSATVQ